MSLTTTREEKIEENIKPLTYVAFCGINVYQFLITFFGVKIILRSPVNGPKNGTKE